MEKLDSFRDDLLSVYRTAVTEVAGKIDERSVGLTRVGMRTTASSVLPDIAADIAAQEYANQKGLPKPPSAPSARELTKAEWSRVCAEQAMRYLKARLTNDAAALAKLNDEAVAGVCDPAWRTTVEQYIKNFGPNVNRK